MCILEIALRQHHDIESSTFTLLGCIHAHTHVSQQCRVLKVMLQLAQIQLHMLDQSTAAITDALAACTKLLVAASQGPQQQPIASQLQLHFCILRTLALLNEGRFVELQKTGEGKRLTWSGLVSVHHPPQAAVTFWVAAWV